MSEPATVFASPDRGLVRFGTFELDLERRVLRRQGGRPLRLAPQPLTVLCALAGRAGELVTRDELRREVWGDGVHVDFERGLSSCVRQVRELLDDSAAEPRFIETIPRRGYRFIAATESVPRPRLAAVAPFRPATAPEPAAVVDEARALAAPSRRSPLAGLAAPLATALAVALVATLAAVALRRAAPAADGRQRLVVLPFEDDESGALGAGFTEEVVSRLSALDPDRLGVLSRASVGALARDGRSALEIAAELDAGLLVEGAVRSDGERLRITARLFDPRDGASRWSTAIDSPAGDLLAAQDEVADRVAAALALRLDAPADTPMPPAEAQALYLRGRGLLGAGDARSFGEARAALERAVEIEPRYAAAWAAKAELAAYAAFGPAAWSPAEAAGEVERTAARALALDPTQAGAELARAISAFYFRRDLAAAEAAFERALALRPGLPRIRHWFAGLRSAEGRHRDALALMRDAEALDPRSPAVVADVAWFSFFAGELATAERAAGRLTALAPGSPAGWGCLAESRRARGDIASAWAAERRRLAARGTAEAALAPLDPLPAAEALRHADVLTLDEARRDPSRVSPVFTAVSALRLGDRAATLDWLAAGVDRLDPWALFLRVDPRFDPLRGDPKFEALVARAVGGA